MVVAEAPVWLALPRAAALLDMSADALRRALERRAVRAPDGGIEAELDGIRGRKLAGRWRVQLGPAWQPRDDGEPKPPQGGHGTSSGAGPQHAPKPGRTPA